MEILRPMIIAMFMICGLLVLLALNGVVTGNWDAVSQAVAPVVLIAVIISFAVSVVIDLT